MVKRLLSASTSEVMQFNGQQLKESIKKRNNHKIVPFTLPIYFSIPTELHNVHILVR